MSEKEDGGAAFPDLRNEIYGTGERASYMSLRDWFAGQALAGWISDGVSYGCDMEYIAKACYEQADAMIAAREARHETNGI